MEPPRGEAWIKRLCGQGRVTGARKIKGRWRVPRNAKIKGAGLRAKSVTLRGLSLHEYAALHGVSKQRVHFLLREGRIEGGDP